MIRERLPDARIGIFVHAQFVSSEIFRCLPRKSVSLSLRSKKDLTT